LEWQNYGATLRSKSRVWKQLLCHGTPELATLRNVIHIVGDHDVRIKRVSALLTIAIGVV